MTEGLDRSSDRAAWRQLADLLRRQILTGELPEGSDLPSKRQLAEQYSVSITGVVDPAFAALRADGLIATERGRNARVLPVRVDILRRYRVGRDSYRPDVESTFAAEHGVPWSQFAPALQRVYRTIPASAQVAGYLGLDEGTPVVERRWIHVVEGVVNRVAWSYLEEARFGGTILCDPDEPPWPGGTIAQLRHLGHDVKADDLDIGARRPTQDERDLFGVPESEIMLDLWRVHRAGMQGQGAPYGRPVETALHVWRASTKRIKVVVPLDHDPVAALQG